MAVNHHMEYISHGHSLTPDLDNVYWLDSGTENASEAVYYDASREYAYWNNGSAWLISAVADVSGSPTNYFKAVSSTAYTAQGSWSGTVVMDSYTLSDGWRLAEDTCFDSLADFLGATEGRDAFKGYLPVNEDGQPKFSNVWMMETGSTAGAFDVARTYGVSGNWCNMLINGTVRGLFENRDTAMRHGGAVMAWLKSTDNMHEQTNVNWCHLRELPDPPAEQIIGVRRYWAVEVSLEILYLTESVYVAG